MTKPKFREQLSYRFDNFMAKGGKSVFVILFFLFITAFSCLSLFRAGLESLGFASARGEGFLRQIYITFLQMTDPGNMAQDIDSSPLLKISTILAGMAGIILLSMLIGFITTALVQKMGDLRKGHSKVIEENHTIILGWNPQRVLEIIRELVMANESEDNPAIVILADIPKDEMDDYLKLALPDTKNTRVVTRSGSISNSLNFQIISVECCRSAIILASASEDEDSAAMAISDAQTIKSILALASARGNDHTLNIVAELFDVRNKDIVQMSCQHPITVANGNEILAKIIVQTSRSVGLSVVYSEILSFDGCEMYFHNAKWNGITFGESLYRFQDGVPMGIRTGAGEVLINPSDDRILEDNDDILILADDDSTVAFRQTAVATAEDLLLPDKRLEQILENELIIGYNKKVSCIIGEYADYVLEGSTIDILVCNPSEAVVNEIESYQRNYPKLNISLIDADPLSFDALKSVLPATRNNILILSGGDEDANEADARTILILLLLRKVVSDYTGDCVKTRLITEIMDSANKNLISEAGVKDFIISNQFISMLIAQISEEASIKEVYDNLFEEDGSEIYIKPAHLYFEKASVDVSFADCMAIARKRNEICIGIKIKSLEMNQEQNYGVNLIPFKNSRFTLVSEDCLVVVAEDET
jgi:hypothetical protein